MNADQEAPDVGPAGPPSVQLRPLFLPAPESELMPSIGEVGGGVRDRTIPEYNVFGVPLVEAERLFWYRWIVGHQLSFSLWRAMRDVLESCSDDVPSRFEIDILTACVDSYSAMLLYSATVPNEHYHSYIRHRMSLQHPAFSGTWAPDYRPVRRIFRGKIPWQDDPSCGPLTDALARNAATHDYIADHLVPNGRSLLQQSARAASQTVSREKEDLYDNFFLTVRRRVNRGEFIDQFAARVAGVGADLAHNGLYPNVDGRHHVVVTGLSGGVMMSLVPDVLRVLDDATRLVAEQHLQVESV